MVVSHAAMARVCLYVERCCVRMTAGEDRMIKLMLAYGDRSEIPIQKMRDEVLCAIKVVMLVSVLCDWPRC